MIQSLDETIKRLLIDKTPLDPREVEISFEVPKRDWAAGLTRPTINLYLYDIRENLTLKETQQGWLVERDLAKGTSVKRRAPLRVDVSYLITAWTRAVEDEHSLLWHVLATLFQYPELPPDFLQGQLKGEPTPIPTEVARVDGALKNAADFWTALDNQLKPSLHYQVTLPLDVARLKVVSGPPVRLKITRILDRHEPARQEEMHLRAGIGGVVAVAGSGKDGTEEAVGGATVSLVEAGRQVLSDTAGFYRFTNLDKGNYTIKIEKGGFETVETKVEFDGKKCRTLSFALKRT